jgi:hypothetical protein
VGAKIHRIRLDLLPPVLLPSLTSLYLPLAVAANLPGELLRASDFLRVATATLAPAALGWALGHAALRPTNAALVSVLVVAAFSSLGARAEVVEIPFGASAVDLLSATGWWDQRTLRKLRSCLLSRSLWRGSEKPRVLQYG